MRKFVRLNNFVNSLIKKNDSGFSLLELVVSIAIVLVLTVGGLIGYSVISKNAKQASVESAAATVIKMIAIKESSVSSNVSSNGSFEVQNINTVSNDYVYNEPQDAADEWMRSAGDKNKISVEAGAEDDFLTVKAVYDNDEEIQALKTAPMSSFSGNYDGNTTTPGDSDGDDTGGNGGNNEDDDNSGSNNGGSDNENSGGTGSDVDLIQLDQGSCHPLVFAYFEADYNYTKERSTPNVQKLFALKDKGTLTDEELEEFNSANSNTQKNSQKKTEAENNLVQNSEAYDDLVARSGKAETTEGKSLSDNVQKTANDYTSESGKINSERKFENPDKVNEMYIESLNANAKFYNYLCS